MTEKPRFSVTLDDDLFEKLETYRYKNRFSTRSKAAAHLISVALDAIERENSSPDEQPKLSEEEILLIRGFQEMGGESQRYILMMARDALGAKRAASETSSSSQGKDTA